VKVGRQPPDSNRESQQESDAPILDWLTADLPGSQSAFEPLLPRRKYGGPLTERWENAQQDAAHRYKEECRGEQQQRIGSISAVIAG
jgi:hypothetical protein